LCRTFRKKKNCALASSQFFLESFQKFDLKEVGFSLKVVGKYELTKFRKISFSSPDFQFLEMKELKSIPRDAHSYMIEP
jgi:hypothetical protein